MGSGGVVDERRWELACAVVDVEGGDDGWE